MIGDEAFASKRVDSGMAAEERSTPDSVPHWLLGRWRLLRAAPSLEFVIGTRMEFLPHGELRYGIPVAGRVQHFSLVYRVQGDVLQTDNPAAPHAAVTSFRLGPAGVLVFDFAGAEAAFVRETD